MASSSDAVPRSWLIARRGCRRSAETARTRRRRSTGRRSESPTPPGPPAPHTPRRPLPAPTCGAEAALPGFVCPTRSPPFSRSGQPEQLHRCRVEHDDEESRKDQEPDGEQHPDLRPLRRLHQFEPSPIPKRAHLGPQGLRHGGAVLGRGPDRRRERLRVRQSHLTRQPGDRSGRRLTAKSNLAQQPSKLVEQRSLSRGRGLVDRPLDAKPRRDGEGGELGEVDEVLPHAAAPGLGAALEDRLGQEEPSCRGDEPEPDRRQRSEAERGGCGKERKPDERSGELLALEQRQPAAVASRAEPLLRGSQVEPEPAEDPGDPLSGALQCGPQGLLEQARTEHGLSGARRVGVDLRGERGEALREARPGSTEWLGRQDQQQPRPEQHAEEQDVAHRELPSIRAVRCIATYPAQIRAMANARTACPDAVSNGARYAGFAWRMARSSRTGTAATIRAETRFRVCRARASLIAAACPVVASARASSTSDRFLEPSRSAVPSAEASRSAEGSATRSAKARAASCRPDTLASATSRRRSPRHPRNRGGDRPAGKRRDRPPRSHVARRRSDSTGEGAWPRRPEQRGGGGSPFGTDQCIEDEQQPEPEHGRGEQRVHPYPSRTVVAPFGEGAVASSSSRSANRGRTPVGTRPPGSQRNRSFVRTRPASSPATSATCTTRRVPVWWSSRRWTTRSTVSAIISLATSGVSCSSAMRT